MVVLNQTILLIALKINSLNTPIKRGSQNGLKRTNDMTYDMYSKIKADNFNVKE